MAYLFEVVNKSVVPTTEALRTPPYKEIWERDESSGKEVAIQEFTYIEFVSSMKKSNPYRQYPENIKPKKVREDVIFEENWEPDELIQKAINKIQIFQEEASTTYSYYMAAKIAAEKMKDFFLTVDMTEKNERNGNPIYKPRDLTSALNDTEKVLANLKNLEKKVEEELFESSKMRSDKKVSPFASKESFQRRS